MIPPRIKYRKKILYILDQRDIPFRISYFKAKKVDDVTKAIKEMMVRGAPLIGDTAALGYLIGIDNIISKKLINKKDIIKEIVSNSLKLKSSRPTAVSLFKNTERVHLKAMEFLSGCDNKLTTKDISELRKTVLKEASDILEEDRISTLNIAENGIKLLKKNSRVITYCNTGALATYGIGTALGIITEGYKKGIINFVYACETRPYLQGARLTAWELLKNKIPSMLICDNMAGWIMKTEKIDAVIIGADRIALNGDTANKIGSYSLSLLAQKHKIPFYVAAPTDTFDIEIKDGTQIKIEERSSDEVTHIKERPIAHKDIKARHPAFDVVPAGFITAIITEKGIINRPDYKKVKKNLL
jgi:methylthioribose-1-phosphate isomerase